MCQCSGTTYCERILCKITETQKLLHDSVPSLCFVCLLGTFPFTYSSVISHTQADLIHLGAKFTPCMRKDAKIIKEIEKGREKERETACCIRNDDSGCVQSSQADCSVSFISCLFLSVLMYTYYRNQNYLTCSFQLKNVTLFIQFCLY